MVVYNSIIALGVKQAKIKMILMGLVHLMADWNQKNDMKEVLIDFENITILLCFCFKTYFKRLSVEQREGE